MTEQLQREASESGRMCPAEGDWGTAVQEERILRRSFFERQHRFASALCDLSNTLRAQPKGGGGRDAMLRSRLIQLAEGLPDGVYVPLGGGSDRARWAPQPLLKRQARSFDLTTSRLDCLLRAQTDPER